jgi:phosphopantothenoylcysteine decarboxylase/phosphopantothenate--cysteine ligase
MNEQMWNNPAVQANIALLRRRGIAMIGPESGWQACRTIGIGRMSEPDAIIQAIMSRVPNH